MSRKPIRIETAEDYYVNDLDSLGYYTEQRERAGQWWGRGAAALGLAGEVSPEQFKAALQGLHPLTGAQIVPRANDGTHSPAWDCCFSAPKSISIQALAGGDNRLIEAHVRALDKTLPEVEKFALCLQHGSKEYVVSSNLLAARFNHFTARPASDAVPDAHLHTHCVIMNATRRQGDGQWRGLQVLQLYRTQAFGTALYLSELAAEVQKLGYEIQQTSSYGAFEIAGYTPNHIKAFSQRRDQILEYMHDKGMDGYISSVAGHIGRLNTRAPKEHVDKWTLEAGWRQRAVENGIPLTNHLNQALKRGPCLPTVEPQLAAKAVEFARTHTTEREAVVDRRALEEHALEYGMGRIDLSSVRSQMRVEEKQGQLIPAGNSNSTYPHWTSWNWDRTWHLGGAFTTDEMLKLERENVEMLRAGVGKARAIADRTEVAAWALRKGLLPDQIGVAQLTLGSTDWVTAIEGPAGSTKTHTVGAIREFTEGHGYTVRGFGRTSGSVEALREAGVNAQTVALLLAAPLPVPDPRELWIVDESSLLDTRAVNALLKAARELGVNRIVFVGDQRQHQAIEAGAPLRQFLHENMAVGNLTEIRRQRDPALKHAVELARDNAPAALQLLEEQQRVNEIPDAESRYQRIGLDFLRSHEVGKSTLVVSPANEERRELNKQIRKLLIDQGHVEQHGQQHAILVQRDMTLAQRRNAASYQTGDVIHFKHGAPHISQGSYLQVSSVNWDTSTVILHGKDGARIDFKPSTGKAANNLQVYEWEHRTVAVGDRVQFRIHDKKNAIANGTLATITKLDHNEATLHFDSRRQRKLTIPLSHLRHIDYGYASTSHAAQGATVDRVIVNIDSTRSDQLVNREQFYVSISRARFDARVYTDDKEALRRVVARERQKEIALDAVKPQQATQQVQPQQPQQSTGLSMSI